jgi:hypothetical protein
VEEARSGKAVAALVLGIAGLLIAPIVCSTLAIVFGVLARRDIDQRPALTGRGLATAGIVLGVLGLALGLVWLVVFL